MGGKDLTKRNLSLTNGSKMAFGRVNTLKTHSVLKIAITMFP